MGCVAAQRDLAGGGDQPGFGLLQRLARGTVAAQAFFGGQFGEQKEQFFALVGVDALQRAIAGLECFGLGPVRQNDFMGFAHEMDIGRPWLGGGCDAFHPGQMLGRDQHL